MILTVAFRYFRSIPCGVPSGISERDGEEEMGQDIVSYVPNVPEGISYNTLVFLHL